MGAGNSVNGHPVFASPLPHVRKVLQRISKVEVEMSHVGKPQPRPRRPILWSRVREDYGVCENDVAEDTLRDHPYMTSKTFLDF